MHALLQPYLPPSCSERPSLPDTKVLFAERIPPAKPLTVEVTDPGIDRLTYTEIGRSVAGYGA